MFRLPLSFLCDKNTLNKYYNTIATATATTAAKEEKRNKSLAH